jgi:hypothetical protein
MLTPTVTELRRHGHPLDDVLREPRRPAPVRLHGLLGHKPGPRYRAIEIAVRDRREASLLTRN